MLGIESSCDETAAAVLVDGRRVLSSVVASQDDVHAPYGGVVPELASRRHIEVIVPVVERALGEAGVKLGDLDGLAVTQGPGLVGSLLVGCSMAKALAWVHGLPLIGVNHLEGHIYAAFLTEDPPEHPFLALVVSGGHTALYHAPSPLTYRLVGQTRDDAAGEAFDKVAKLLGLGFPGGPIIQKTAERGDPRAIEFPLAQITDGSRDFSFSGVKTSVSQYVKRRGPLSGAQIADVAASFQAAVVEERRRHDAHRHHAVVGALDAGLGLRAAQAHGQRLRQPPHQRGVGREDFLEHAAFHAPGRARHELLGRRVPEHHAQRLVHRDHGVGQAGQHRLEVHFCSGPRQPGTSRGWPALGASRLRTTITRAPGRARRSGSAGRARRRPGARSRRR